MAYATLDDMVEAFGEREVVSLTDRDNLGYIDAALLQKFLDNASGEMDAYLVKRYAVPLVEVSPLLTTYCCDISRYRLSGSDVTEIETVRNRYKDAIRFLEAVRDGKIDLGTGLAPSVDPATQDLSYVVQGENVFSRSRRRC